PPRPTHHPMSHGFAPGRLRSQRLPRITLEFFRESIPILRSVHGGSWRRSEFDPPLRVYSLDRKFDEYRSALSAARFAVSSSAPNFDPRREAWRPPHAAAKALQLR